MKNLIIILFFSVISNATDAQFNAGLHFNYSTQFNIGGGLEAGYLIKKTLYLGADSRLFFNHQINRVIPKFAEGIVGINIRNIQPYISLGYAATGKPSRIRHEGFDSFTKGAGISYIFSRLSLFKISASVISYEVCERINENVSQVLKNGRHLNGLITISYGAFGDNERRKMNFN